MRNWVSASVALFSSCKLLFCKSPLLILLFCAQLVAPPAVFAQDLYADGAKLYAARRYTQAIDYFRAAYTSGNQQANSTYYLALCYHQLGKLEDARQAYTMVVQKFPGTPAAANSQKMLARLGPVVAQSATSDQRVNWSQTPSNVAIPFRKDPQQGWIIIPATIGDVPISMIFDTGAGITTGRQSFIDSNNIKVTETTHHGSLEGAGGEVQSSIVVAEVGVGPIKRNLAIAVEQDESYVANGKQVPTNMPLLGQNFFADLAYTIDDAAKTITFKDPVKVAQQANPDREASYRMDGTTMIIRPKLNGRECDMIFDTGCSLIAFADRHMDECGLVLPPSARSALSGGVGGSRQAFDFSIDTVQLGPVTRRNPQASVMLNSQLPEPLFGQSFLTGLRYTIDPLRKVVRFE